MMETEVSHIGWLGFVTFTIVIGSLFCIMLAAILGKPWRPRVTGIVIGSIFLLFAGFVAMTWVGAKLLGIFIP